MVRVHDHGAPVPLSDTAYLRVIVRSRPSSWQGRMQRHAGSPDGQPAPGRTRSLAAAIAGAVACAAAVLTAVVLLLAVVVRRRTADYKGTATVAPPPTTTVGRIDADTWKR